MDGDDEADTTREKSFSNISLNEDTEKHAGPRVVFGDDERRLPRQSRTQASRRPRSRSHDSISSVRSRAQSTSGIPIEFRTLSFQISDSQANPGHAPEKRGKSADNVERDFFEQLDYHNLSVKNVCDRFNVFQAQGLSKNAAATRLQRDGKNQIPSPPVVSRQLRVGYETHTDSKFDFHSTFFARYSYMCLAASVRSFGLVLSSSSSAGAHLETRHRHTILVWQSWSSS